MTFTRQSVLNDRHKSLGSDLSTGWNDTAIPQNYKTCPYEESAAVRYRAGLFDVSALKIVNVRGPDALSFLNYVLTSDVSKAKPGDSHISNIVNANGGLIDDVLVYVDGPGQYRVSHGGGAFEEVAEAHKGRFNVDVERDDDVHILSLQGPTALYQPAKRFTIAAGENLSDRSVTMT
jgi:aminomethyltransferase